MSAGDLYDWNLNNTQFLINGVPVEGHGDDDAFLFEPNADNYEYNAGAGGAGTRSKTNDRGGQMTFTVKQTSPSNAIFGKWQAATDAGLPDTFSVKVINLDTGESVNAGKAWVHRKSDWGASKVARDNEWILMSSNIKVNYGNGSVVGLPDLSL